MRSTLPRRAVAVLVLAAALPLAGCGGTAGAGSGDGTDTAGDAGGTGEPTAEPTPPTVTLERTGGIAGIRESITVNPDGTWRRASRTGVTAGTLTADQRNRLARMAADPALAAEAGRPAEPTACADGYALTLRVAGSTVRWSECDPATAALPVSAGIARLILDGTG